MGECGEQIGDESGESGREARLRHDSEFQLTVTDHLVAGSVPTRNVEEERLIKMIEQIII